MHLVIREGDLMIEIRAHEGETPRLCAYLAGQEVDDKPHLTSEFNWADFNVFDDLHVALRLVIDGIRPQLASGASR